MAQAELYSLTSRGGPRYMPRSVNRAAFGVLDVLFPAGHRSRRAIASAFRVWFHPLEGPRSLAHAAAGLLRLVMRPVFLAWRRLKGLVVWVAGRWHALQGRLQRSWENIWRPWRGWKRA